MYSSVCFKLKVDTHILSSRRQSQVVQAPGPRHPGPCLSHFSGLSRRSPLAMNARALALLGLGRLVGRAGPSSLDWPSWGLLFFGLPAMATLYEKR